MTNRVVSAVKGTGRVIAETYRLGGRAWLVAPALIAIAVVPEFVQHVAEIQLGMFESLQRFRELSQDSTRWMFGYAKVAGLIIAMLGIARFWAVGSVRKTFAIAPSDLLRLVLAIALTWAASLPFEWLAARDLPVVIVTIVKIASMLIQAGLTLFVVAALFGDRSVTLRTAFTERWPTALVLALAVIAAFVPGQLLHMLNHKLALGQPAAIVWALMVWDSLVVGMIAALVGSALWASYRSGATWRGWAPGFMPEPEVAAEPVEEQVAVPEPAAIPEPVVEAPKPRRPRPGPRPRR